MRRSVARDPDRPADSPQADPDQVARTILLRRLETAPRTRAELARTLARRGVPEEVARTALDRFEEVGLVDDRLFTKMWVDSRQSSRGLSGRALHAELRRKGVDEALIAESLAELSADRERETAVALARRRAIRMDDVPADVASRRLLSFLARKGYSHDVAAAAVREALSVRERTGAEDDDWPQGSEHLR